MGALSDSKPEIAMFGLQFAYAAVALATRAALLQGMNPRVFEVATLVIAPIAYFSRRKSRTRGCSLGLRSFSPTFLAAFIRVTIYQNLYFEGLYLVSPSMARAMGNLLPAVTFIMASIFRWSIVHGIAERPKATILIAFIWKICLWLFGR